MLCDKVKGKIRNESAEKRFPVKSLRFLIGGLAIVGFYSLNAVSPEFKTVSDQVAAIGESVGNTLFHNVLQITGLQDIWTTLSKLAEAQIQGMLSKIGLR